MIILGERMTSQSSTFASVLYSKATDKKCVLLENSRRVSHTVCRTMKTIRKISEINACFVPTRLYTREVYEIIIECTLHVFISITHTLLAVRLCHLLMK